MIVTPRDFDHAFAIAIFDASHRIPGDIVSHAAKVPRRRFDVYRNNVMASLIDVLQAYFPVICRLVGEEFFRATARAFVLASPPRTPILSRYGDRFPDFLDCFEPVHDLPYLGDVARLEWHRQRAYHAADDTALMAADVAALAPSDVPETAFTFHPSVALMDSDYPIISIWRTNTHDATVEAIDVGVGGEAALIVRTGLYVQIWPLAAAARAFVAALMRGTNLADSMRMALEVDSSFDVQAILACLIELGALARCRAPDRKSVPMEAMSCGS